MRATPSKKAGNGLTIGQVARSASVGIETVRFYERQGLIDDPPRKESGYRQYSPDVIDRIRFIRRAQELGFSLKEITELLSLRLDPKRSCGEVKKRARLKLSAIENKIRDLQRMKRALKALLRACVSNAPIRYCPILEAFESEGGDHADR